LISKLREEKTSLVESIEKLSQISPIEIEEIIAKLRKGNIAYNFPETIEYDKTVRINLLLSLEKSIDTLKKELISSEGKKEGAQISVSCTMKATLEGKAFDIKPITEETQSIRASKCEWAWDIKPKKYTFGSQAIDLFLYAILYLEGNPRPPAQIKAYHKTILIKIKWLKRILIFIEKFWPYITVFLTAIFIPLIVHSFKTQRQIKQQQDELAKWEMYFERRCGVDRREGVERRITPSKEYLEKGGIEKRRMRK
jgi:hypothetical protein